jgi:hypothetical protein
VQHELNKNKKKIAVKQSALRFLCATKTIHFLVALLYVTKGERHSAQWLD